MSENPGTQVEAKPRNVVEAIVAVMREVNAVGKDGTNQQQGYNFRGIDGTVNALGPAMRKHGLIVTPGLRRIEHSEVYVGRANTKQGHVQVEVDYTFHFSNPDGELSTLVVPVPGESMDSGDKATAKAMSVAFRICLLQTFAIPTMQPDPDEFTYERSNGPEPVDADTLKGDCNKATQYEDLDAGFADLRSYYGANRLSVTRITHNGVEYDGNAFLDFALGYAKERRVTQQRLEQDTAAQDEAAPAEQPAQQDHAAELAANQARLEAAGRAATAPRETKADRLRKQTRDEGEFQAEVLGVAASTHMAPFLRDASDLDSIIQSKAGKHLVGQRPAVIERLRALGMATVAEAYAGIGQGFPIDTMTRVTEAGEPERQPVGA